MCAVSVNIFCNLTVNVLVETEISTTVVPLARMCSLWYLPLLWFTYVINCLNVIYYRYQVKSGWNC